MARRVLTVSLMALAALALVPQASAQQRIQIGDLVQRIDRLESEVTRLRVSPRAGGGDTVRLDQIEAELRRLTGIIERLEYDNRKLSEASGKRFDRIEERLDSIEDGTPAGLSAAPLVPRAPEPNPPSLSRDAIGAPAYTSETAILTPQPGLTPDTAPTVAYTPPVAGQSPDALYDDGLRLLNRGQFDEAGAQFEELIARHPTDARAGQAQYWLGDMHFKLGRFEQAATAFLESFRNWPEGVKAPDSLLKLGMTLAIIGKREEACLSLSQVPQRYPSASPSLLRRADIESQRAGCGG